MEEKNCNPSEKDGGERSDAARFEAVALPFAQALYNKAFYLARRPEEARDLVQETYLRAFRTFGGFREGTNCKAWLLTILRSIFINKYHKEQRAPATVSLDQMEGMFHQTLADENWDLAALTESAADWRGPEVQQALHNLPETFRSAVLLVDVDGLTYEEAAAVLTCPIGTLRSRLFRARRMLFVELHEYARKVGIIRRSEN